MTGLLRWLDDRTSYRKLVHEALYEPIPGGARWRYVWGSTLVFAFVVQAITGIVLWMAYSPSSQTAWESVYYIQHELPAGWLLRGVHHYMAQAMVVLLALHLLQVIIHGAYRAPREINFWLGLILMQIVLALALTGYLLPWDQKGFWATNVATNLAVNAPAGESLQKLAVGGDSYGHHTLTRFFALHAGVLPGLLIVVLVFHLALFRKYGVKTPEKTKRRMEYFWPGQILKDGVACGLVLLVVLLCVIHWDVGGLFTGDLPDGGKLGAELGAPADAAESYDAARPEWYFLFLFQLLKVFESQFVGAIVVPGIVMLFLFLMPIIGRWKVGHYFNVAVIISLVVACGVLTYAALRHDNYANWVGPEDPREYAASRQYLSAKEDAHRQAERIKSLYHRTDENGTPLQFPVEGALSLKYDDPLLRGPDLFKKNCASCHAYYSADPEDPAVPEWPIYRDPRVDPPPEGETGDKAKVKRDAEGKVLYTVANMTGPNLHRFGSRDWIRGLLNPDMYAMNELAEPEKSDAPFIKDNPEHPDHHRRRIIAPYFGNTAHVAHTQTNADGKEVKVPSGVMHDWLRRNFPRVPQQFADNATAILENKLTATVDKVREKAKQKNLTGVIAKGAAFDELLKEVKDEEEEKELSEDRREAVRIALNMPVLESLHTAARSQLRKEPLEHLVTTSDVEKLLEKAGRAQTSLPPAERRYLAARLRQDQWEDIVIGLSAQARLPAQAEDDKRDADRIARGVRYIKLTCTNGCHSFGDAGPHGLAPDLTGYASWQWTVAFVSNPEHARFYGRTNDRMPAFGKSLENLLANQLAPRDISLIVDWMRGQYYQAGAEKSRLPHSPAAAARAIRSGRATEIERPKIVGEQKSAPPPDSEEALTARAQTLFRQQCAACHNHLDEAGKGIAAERPSASNLYGFASEKWIRGLLNAEKIATAEYFGATRHKNGEMVDYVVDEDRLATYREDDQDGYEAIVKALAAERTGDKPPEAAQEAFSDFECADCHQYHNDEPGSGPDLTGYGSVDWIKAIVSNPRHERFYPDTNDRMPSYRRHVDPARKNRLTEEELDLLARWLRGLPLKK